MCVTDGKLAPDRSRRTFVRKGTSYEAYVHTVYLCMQEQLVKKRIYMTSVLELESSKVARRAAVHVDVRTWSKCVSVATFECLKFLWYGQQDPCLEAKKSQVA